MKKYLLVLMSMLLILSGCSAKKTTDPKLVELTQSAQIENYEKAEYDLEKNKLLVYTNREIISEKDFQDLMKTFSLKTFSKKRIVGTENLSLVDFDNKDFSVEVMAKNNNSASFDMKNPSKVEYKVTETKYSSNYFSTSTREFSKKLTNLHKFVKDIESDLNNGSLNDENVEKFSKESKEIKEFITILKTFNGENTLSDKTVQMNKDIAVVESDIFQIDIAVAGAVRTKYASFITDKSNYVNNILVVAKEFENF